MESSQISASGNGLEHKIFCVYTASQRRLSCKPSDGTCVGLQLVSATPTETCGLLSTAIRAVRPHGGLHRDHLASCSDAGNPLMSQQPPEAPFRAQWPLRSHRVAEPGGQQASGLWGLQVRSLLPSTGGPQGDQGPVSKAAGGWVTWGGGPAWPTRMPVLRELTRGPTVSPP